jgi:hypothetical protein
LITNSFMAGKNIQELLSKKARDNPEASNIQPERPCCKGLIIR